MQRQSRNGTIVQAGIGDLIISVTGSRPLSDDDWTDYVKICREMSSPRPYKVVLNYSPLVGPTAKQRAHFMAELEDLLNKMTHTALVSDSAMVRGALTAMAWVRREQKMNLKAFKPLAVDQALAWLRESADFDIVEGKQLFLSLVKLQGDDPMKVAQ